MLCAARFGFTTLIYQDINGLLFNGKTNRIQHCYVRRKRKGYKMENDTRPKCGSIFLGIYRLTGHKEDLKAAKINSLEKKKAMRESQTGRRYPEHLSCGQVGTTMDGFVTGGPKIRLVRLVANLTFNSSMHTLMK